MTQHFLITRYSVAGPISPAQRWFRKEPLFDPERLAHRLQLFRMATLPSVAAQTDQDFEWIVMVDPALPRTHRDALEESLSVRARTHVVEHAPQPAPWRAAWLAPFVDDAAAPLVSTLLDDDDALPRTFMAALRNAAADVRGMPAHPWFRIFAYRGPRQWDLKPGASAPLGTCAPWHRRRKGKTYPAAPGLTLQTSASSYDVNVLAIAHTSAIDVLEPGLRMTDPDGRNMRRLLVAAARAAGDDPASWSPALRFRALDAVTAPPTMLNHAFNDQARRLMETKPGAVPVTGPQSFPDTCFDWAEVRRCFDDAPIAED